MSPILRMPKVGLVDTLIPTQNSSVGRSSISPLCHEKDPEGIAVTNTHPSRDRALNQIETLLLLDLQATELGMAMTNLAGALDESPDITQALNDAFATEATGTIVKRTTSFWNNAKWRLPIILPLFNREAGLLLHVLHEGSGACADQHIPFLGVFGTFLGPT